MKRRRVNVDDNDLFKLIVSSNSSSQDSGGRVASIDRSSTDLPPTKTVTQSIEVIDLVSSSEDEDSDSDSDSSVEFIVPASAVLPRVMRSPAPKQTSKQTSQILSKLRTPQKNLQVKSRSLKQTQLNQFFSATKQSQQQMDTSRQQSRTSQTFKSHSKGERTQKVQQPETFVQASPKLTPRKRRASPEGHAAHVSQQEEESQSSSKTRFRQPNFDEDIAFRDSAPSSTFDILDYLSRHDAPQPVPSAIVYEDEPMLDVPHPDNTSLSKSKGTDASSWITPNRRRSTLLRQSTLHIGLDEDHTPSGRDLGDEDMPSSISIQKSQDDDIISGLNVHNLRVKAPAITGAGASTSQPAARGTPASGTAQADDDGELSLTPPNLEKNRTRKSKAVARGNQEDIIMIGSEDIIRDERHEAEPPSQLEQEKIVREEEQLAPSQDRVDYQQHTMQMLLDLEDMQDDHMLAGDENDNSQQHVAADAGVTHQPFPEEVYQSYHRQHQRVSFEDAVDSCGEDLSCKFDVLPASDQEVAKPKPISQLALAQDILSYPTAPFMQQNGQSGISLDSQLLDDSDALSLGDCGVSSQRHASPVLSLYRNDDDDDVDADLFDDDGSHQALFMMSQDRFHPHNSQELSLEDDAQRL